MRVVVLASGSTGNCSLIMTRSHKVLMDSGLSGKQTKALLAEVNVDIRDIDLVFLSHDHSDHSKGLGVLMRRYPKIAAYANSGTWQYLLGSHKVGKLPAEQMNVIEPGQTLTFDELQVTAFATSHDASEPQYYVFSSHHKRLACLTDTGYVSAQVEQVIRASDAYLMEFNYDTIMLRNGPYSWSLKDRILSDCGHLSNQEAAEALADVVSERTHFIFLAHRSQHNNTKAKAHAVAAQVLAQQGNLRADVELIDTDPDCPTKMIHL